MGERAKGRDLLAERIRRLERQVGEMARRAVAAEERLDRACEQLEAVVVLVGRLGRVVDVQGSSLHGGEDALGQKVGSIEDQVAALAAGLGRLAERLDVVQAQLAEALAGRERRP